MLFDNSNTQFLKRISYFESSNNQNNFHPSPFPHLCHSDFVNFDGLDFARNHFHRLIYLKYKIIFILINFVSKLKKKIF